MGIRTILLTAVIGAAAAMPAAALADLQVNADGFHRVVTETSHGDSCHVHRNGDGTIVNCADGSKGTMTLYRHSHDTPACEVDFWTQSNGSGAMQWRAQLSHQNTANGTCSTHWENPTTLDVTLSS